MSSNHNQAHGVLVAACLLKLRELGLPAWKQNTGAAKIAGRFIRFSQAGTPDILAVGPGGRFVGIECKTGAGRPNKAQKAWHETARNAGALVLVVRSERELEVALKGVQSE